MAATNHEGRYKDPDCDMVIDLVHLKHDLYRATLSDDTVGCYKSVVVKYHPGPITFISPSTRRRPIQCELPGPGFAQMMGGKCYGGVNFPVAWKVDAATS